MDGNQQQIVNTIKTTSNILVTVSTDPTVDELSAALGLTLLLDKLDKRATAIFSGNMPPAISFLEPDKTFENTPDSLRDFIIALNKEKADHLRYKVDGDVVKIFITPYKTTLSQADLEFSQGDYNVELIIALGVKDQDHLDKALDAHGKILHDAKVMTMVVGADGSSLGSVNWQEKEASSLCEMIGMIADNLKEKDSLFDEQIATALLTGIVSATDRFSNDHTTSRVMTMAAQLMAAGANQQLIASKLEEGHDLAPSAPQPEAAGDTPPTEDNNKSGDGSELVIERDGDSQPVEQKIDKVIEPPVETQPAPEMTTEDSDQAELEKQLAGLNGGQEGGGGDQASSDATLADIENELKQAVSDSVDGGNQTPPADENAPVSDQPPAIIQEHGPPIATSMDGETPALNGIQSAQAEELPTVDPFNVPATPHEGATVTPAETPVASEGGGTPDIAAALAAPMDAPVSPDIAMPQQGPSDPAAPAAPPLNFAMPVMEPAPEPAPEPEPAGPPPEISPAQAIDPEVPELPPLPPLPPLPADANLPPLPPPPPPPAAFGGAGGAMPTGAVSGDVFGDAAAAAPAAPPANEPGMFKIPGQS